MAKLQDISTEVYWAIEIETISIAKRHKDNFNLRLVQKGMFYIKVKY